MSADILAVFKDVMGGLSWTEDANCKNMDTKIFFPTDGANIDPFVKEVCAECPVNIECLWYANETSTDFGVYGGMSPLQRRRWRSKNKIELGQSYSDWIDNGFRNSH